MLFKACFFCLGKEFMPKAAESGLENPVSINIRVVRNGVTVSGRCDDKDMEYVYTTLDKALKEVPGLVSVLSEDPKKLTEKDLDKEEERIKGEDY